MLKKNTHLKPQFCSRSSGEGIPLYITYYFPLNLFIFCYLASQYKACFPISLPLKPIVLGLAQCLQFMLPCFEFSCGYPLLQPNFFRVIILLPFSHIYSNFISYHSSKVKKKMPVTSMLPNAMDNVISHHLSPNYLFFWGIAMKHLRIIYFQCVLQALPTLLDLRMSWWFVYM